MASGDAAAAAVNDEEKVLLLSKRQQQQRLEQITVYGTDTTQTQNPQITRG